MVSRRNKTRTYTRHTCKGKLILVSWIQLKCECCGKFLSKGRRKFCSVCAKRMLLIWSQNRCQKCQRFLGKHGRKWCPKCAILKYKECQRKGNKKWIKNNYERSKEIKRNWYYRHKLKKLCD